MRILITGATGFIGREIVKELSKTEGLKLFLTGSLNSDGKKELFGGIGKFFQVDVGNRESVGQLLKIGQIDVVIHAAGLAHQFGSVKRVDFWRTNVSGTENLCHLSNDLSVKHFILISSVSVYGNYGKIEVTEDFECQPSGDYAESKWFSEQKALEICSKYNIKLTILRLGTVVGENDRGNTARLITQISKNRFLWIGKGENKKSLIYKSDVAEIISQIIKRTDFLGGIFNLTTKAIKMKEIVDTIFITLGKKPPNVFLPKILVKKILGFNKIGNVKFLKKFELTINKWLSTEIYSGEKLLNKYQIEPRTSIFEAIERQVTFYKGSTKHSEKNKR